MVSSSSRFRQANDTIRSTISIGARFRAIDRFKALAGAVLFSNNALLRFGRSLAITTAGFTVVEMGLKLLFNRFTAIFALVQAGLATRQWIIYERAARNVQFQLRLTGLEASVAADRLNDVKTIMGSTAAAKFYKAYEEDAMALANIGGAADQVLELMKEMDDKNIDNWLEIGHVFAQLLEGKISEEAGIRELQRLFPGLGEDVTSAADAFERIKVAVEDTDITNIEQIGKVMGDIPEKLEPIGKLIDETIGQVGVWAAQFNLHLVGMIIDTPTNLWNGVRLILDDVNNVGKTIGSIILAGIRGEFDQIPGMVSSWWQTQGNRIEENVRPYAAVVGVGIGFALGGPIGAIAGGIAGERIGRGLEDAFAGEGTQASINLAIAGASIGAILGPKIGYTTGIAAGAALGVVIGQYASNVANQDTETGKAIAGGATLIGATVGLIIGTAIGGPMGAAAGAAVGSFLLPAITEAVQEQTETGSPWILNLVNNMFGTDFQDESKIRGAKIGDALLQGVAAITTQPGRAELMKRMGEWIAEHIGSNANWVSTHGR